MSLNSTPGDPAADSYFQIADADAYFTARNNAAWAAATTGDKEAAARAGTQYIDNQYRGRWIGISTNQNQALCWPRVDGTRGGFGQLNGMTYGYGTTGYYGYVYPLFDIDGWQIGTDAIPPGVAKAAMEAALLALNGTTLEPQLVRGGMIKSLDEQVGPIRQQTVWQDGAGGIDRYLVIEGYLRGLVTSTPGSPAGNVRIVRS